MWVMTAPSSEPQGDLAQLLAAAAAGDEESWRALLGLYARRVYALARSRCRRDDLAEEITQSVFVTVASKLSTGGYAEQGRFESWLFRVTMNRVRDEMRRLKRHAEVSDPLMLADASPAAEEAARPEARELAALRDAMDVLTEDDREVVALRHHAGLSFKQIASMLGEPLGTVLARHHRALRKLRTSLEGAGIGGDEANDDSEGNS